MFSRNKCDGTYVPKLQLRGLPNKATPKVSTKEYLKIRRLPRMEAFAKVCLWAVVILSFFRSNSLHPHGPYTPLDLPYYKCSYYLSQGIDLTFEI